MEKRKISIIVITVLALITILGVSYAYFTAELQGMETATTLTVGAGTMGINYNGGNNIVVSNIIPGDETVATKTFTLTGNNTTDLMMPYELWIVVEENNFETGISYTLEGSNPSGNGALALDIVDPIQLPNVNGETYSLGTGAFAGGTGTVHTYTLKLYFFDVPGYNQNVDQGATFKAHINVTGDVTQKLNKHLMSLAFAPQENGLYVENTEFYQDYRYEGENPDNYISFNNELWRIIGVFGASTHGQLGGRLVKIIRETPTKDTVFNNGGGLQYPESSLFYHLNFIYYETIAENYRRMINHANWQYNQVYYMNENAEGVYNLERVGSYAITYYIGLMLPSDYGYAARETECDRTTNLDNYHHTSCALASWLKPTGDPEWTSIIYPMYDGMPWIIGNSGALSYLNADAALSYRPSLYLSDEVIIVSGDGSKENPYIIDMAV